MPRALTFNARRIDMSDRPSTEAAILDHSCDGIQEYDNALPGWWTAIFWATIVFSAFYPIYYHYGIGQSVYAEYDAELAEAADAQLARLGVLTPDNATIVSCSTNPKMLLVGRAMFRANCAVCHGADGGGNVGPNLCDGQYINVQQPTDIFRIINEGVVAKGMPAWSARFNTTQTVVLAAYVASLRGTQPAAPKAPQGTYEPAAWSTFASAVPAADGAAASAPAAAGASETGAK